jgi:tetratricopeptide (TPR) repeat protein
MALRLTGTTLQSERPAAPSGDLLVIQARTALARGDVAAYSALFADANSLTDPHIRFGAHLGLLQAGLQATATATEGAALRVFVAIADASLTLLESNPAEPILLNLAGVACYELWSLDAAQALFRAARRLDPDLSDAERNLREVAGRRRAGRRIRPLHAAVPGLARRATSVAARAKPATGLTLSLCMIVRDEEQMLPRCLAAVAPAVDEIIVVDTGSVDATVEIARSFGARVVEHPWTGSFSEARNVSFEAATGDWVMYLDADEVLVQEDVEQLRAVTGRTWREAFYLVETSYTGELGDGSAIVNNALRVFRNRPEYRFTDRLHEQIAHTLPTHLPGRLEQTPVRVQHYGYLGSIRDAKEKSKRNVELLRRQAAEAPATPFLHFNLGSEYAAAGDPASAVTELRQAQSMLMAEDGLRGCEFGPPLMFRLTMALRMCGRLEEADAAAAEALQAFPGFTDLILGQARTAQSRGDLDGAVRLYERCIELGDAPARFGGMLGCGTFLPRVALAEIDLDRGDVSAARSRLEWCVAHHPDFLGVVRPYATTLLRDGVAPADVVARLESLMSLPTQARISIAVAMRQAGELAMAEEQYRRVLDASPAQAWLRTTLGELVLARGSWDEAAQAVGDVDVNDPHAALACRIELLARIGRSDADTVRAGLVRAEQAGLPRAEQTVFRAWAEMAEGGEVVEGLPVAGMPVLTVILETLLGAGDGDRFNALLPALSASRLERREQRELLATMFVSHGLLPQAAQEWMAVCAEQPDARALIGLGRIAERSGMAEDAATFAAGALELDPQSAAARELLARLPAPAAVGAGVGAAVGAGAGAAVGAGAKAAGAEVAVDA